MNQNPFKAILQAFKYRLNLDADKANEDEVIDRVTRSIEFRGTNLWTLVFAIFIASIGLNVNSTAVIIGAMLISPLMGPIMGVGIGAGIYDFKLINKAAKNLLIATLIGLFTSTLYFLISPLTYAQSELLARTSPTIWDVLIAFFGGLAGIVAASRKNFNNIIPGVAIATALMPPLCTAGFGIATGQWSYFFGAIYLYLINSVFISISTFLIVRFLKYKPVVYVNPGTSARVKRLVITIAVLTIIPSLYLAYNFVQHEIFTQNANKLISEEAVSQYTILNKKIFPKKKLILLTILDEAKVDSVRDFLALKKERYELTDATIVVKSSFSKNTIPDINQLKEGLIENLFTRQEEQLMIRNEELADLKKQAAIQNSFVLKREEAINEFYALYGKPQELAIETVINHKINSTDTVLMVYFKTNSRKFGRAELKKIEAWFGAKFNTTNIKVIKE